LGIPYGHFFGHRGFFHSLFFALILGFIGSWVFFPQRKPFWKQRTFLFLYFSLLVSTHGILDALTSGGLGIALFSPFDTSRYFFPWTPIQVAPIGVRHLFSAWGLRVLLSEMIWVWIPALVMICLATWLRRRKGN